MMPHPYRFLGQPYGLEVVAFFVLGVGMVGAYVGVLDIHHSSGSSRTNEYTLGVLTLGLLLPSSCISVYANHSMQWRLLFGLVLFSAATSVALCSPADTY